MKLVLTIFMLILSSKAFAVTGRSFGVFTVSYTSGQTHAIGGIAGTAFFVSKNRAITAYHVLQPASFHPHSGFDHVKVWLVHENHIAIQLSERNLHYFPDRDETVIDLEGVSVEDQFVFQKATGWAIGAHAETEGFMVNSLGPTLAFAGAEIQVVSVPQLMRLHLNGDVTNASRISLNAKDIALREAPCVQLDYRPIVGISGGPVIVDGKVVGMNSFSESVIGTRTWAVTLPADI